MPVPHTLLIGAAVAGLWWAGHFWSCSQPAMQASSTPPGFALPGSAYGSLTARVMRDSLYSYWHGGESAQPAMPKPAETPQSASPPPPPSPPPGRFARRGVPPPPPPPPTPAASASWLERGVIEVARLEYGRTKNNTRFAPTAAHRRYLNASVGWRLRLAHELDPGDAILYEILHFHLGAQGQPGEATQKLVNALADEATQHALAPRASMSDALTGAGAAINLLNDQLQRGRTIVSGDPAILQNWNLLNQCLDRYRAVRKQADDESWWEGIPAVRREEIESHAALLERIAETIGKTLVEMKIIPSPAAGAPARP